MWVIKISIIKIEVIYFFYYFLDSSCNTRSLSKKDVLRNEKNTSKITNSVINYKKPNKKNTNSKKSNYHSNNPKSNFF